MNRYRRYGRKAVMGFNDKIVDVNFESLLRIFTVPEAPDSTLGNIEQKLSQNLNEFYENILSRKKTLIRN